MSVQKSKDYEEFQDSSKKRKKRGTPGKEKVEDGIRLKKRRRKSEILIDEEEGEY